jgi:hypothetical protein
MVRKDQKEIKFVKRQNSEHPYCTNWPMSMEENEIEICICCGKKTKYKKSDNVTQRQDYIEGAGQLCFECGEKDNKEAEYARKLWKDSIE